MIPACSRCPVKPSTMLFIDTLTAKKLLAIGHDAGIENVRAVSSDALAETNSLTALTLRTQNGPVHIIWDTENGEALIIYFLPLLILSVLLDPRADGDPDASYFA